MLYGNQPLRKFMDPPTQAGERTNGEVAAGNRGATFPAPRFAQNLGRFVSLNLCNSIQTDRGPQRMVRNSTV
jgi:hypothetical protein